MFKLRFHAKASFLNLCSISKLSNSFLSRWQSAMDAREPRDRFRHFESTLSFTDYHVACHHPVPFSARGTRQQALSHYESGSLKLQWTDKLHYILITYLNGIWGGCYSIYGGMYKFIHFWGVADEEALMEGCLNGGAIFGIHGGAQEGRWIHIWSIFYLQKRDFLISMFVWAWKGGAPPSAPPWINFRNIKIWYVTINQNKKSLIFDYY